MIGFIQHRRLGLDRLWLKPIFRGKGSAQEFSFAAGARVSPFLPPDQKKDGGTLIVELLRLTTVRRTEAQQVTGGTGGLEMIGGAVVVNYKKTKHAVVYIPLLPLDRSLSDLFQSSSSNGSSSSSVLGSTKIR